ncbi:hypothetical protein [Streptomyces sp. NPDC005799]|uniref:hypothetical protein n=1 Tax=Streptomyces sp. NPDC005799 TaxID=3154678 RepID=UPI0033EE075F
MPMNENVITLRFTNRAAAYQALGALRHLNAAGAEIHGAVLVERPDDGAVRVTEEADGEVRRIGVADARIAQTPPGAAVVLAAVAESGTDTLDMLALWYGAVLERRPVDGVRAGLYALEGGADEVSAVGARVATGWREGRRAGAPGTPSAGVAVLSRMSAA